MLFLANRNNQVDCDLIRPPSRRRNISPFVCNSRTRVGTLRRLAFQAIERDGPRSYCASMRAFAHGLRNFPQEFCRAAIPSPQVPSVTRGTLVAPLIFLPRAQRARGFKRRSCQWIDLLSA
jgi:hypothetical protein